MPNEHKPIFTVKARRKAPDSPMRVEPVDSPPPPALVPETSTELVPVSSETAAKLEREHLVKETSKVKFGLGVGLALSVTAVGSFLLFRLLNRMKVEGLENLPDSHENILFCPNHSSLLDNFAIGAATYIPRAFLHPEFMPINLADRKNFFGDPKSRRFKDKVLRILGEYFFKNMRTFPVDRGQGGMDQVEQWKELLKNNIVIVFPEGTRSRSGEIGRGRAGVGKLIYDSRPTVVPCRLIGTDEVLGVGSLIPNVFRTVRIIIGKPIDVSGLATLELPEDEKERLDMYRAISDYVVEQIRALTPGQSLPSDKARREAAAAKAKAEAEAETATKSNA
ncbi:MAG: 1-acyl-sn-glycerol-3-phosphate acyltransferase [Blastocatellia bacterium]|nr:1-acyl-sn-glycerol-3-phosphate acyltransferase [Blastocatellia bacterium]